ncbi:actin-related protein 8-like [Rhagoletis pomonella]|uniref:LOW QUALITY PROTEIN: actin-related protein 8-like n=1 Tax=Rhagoletis pomonella TaxID=28610 RepID=UPI001781AC4E|nr:LOW QUALITY PROTEIN: actin-related protein 8-like [Rhagoletis pomonella]XP_036345412.1 actin-related protein 8-like [Rhagoletis pomonella]
MQAQRIIIIHPGSLYLRIGRASDLNPITILHAVAHLRRGNKNSQNHKDALLPNVQSSAETIAEFEEQRLQVSHSIQSYAPLREPHERSAKRLRVATPPQQIATFNRRSVPEDLPLSDDEDSEAIKHEMRDTRKKDELLFDKDILSLREEESMEYNIHFPLRRGEFNLHKYVGGSTAAVISHMETIWLYALRKHLNISAGTLPHYSAVLVIPDVYNRSHLRELTTLLLQRLRFRSCFLLQDHVAATFGAGLSYACVVDIGDQKCSISCVEDGISHPETRVRLSYGGGDVTQVFLNLLRKCGFPYKDCNVETDYSDAALLMDLKERFCHLTLDVCGAQERNFEVKKANKKMRYTLQIGDECVVAPLSLFHTELLNITTKTKQANVQLRSSQQPDPEDCFDAEYIRETGRRNGGRDQLLEGALPSTGEVAEDDLVVDDVVERDVNVKTGDKDELLYMFNGQILPLDHAIVRSIERCSTEEIKRKMYSCILLVGGSTKFAGFAKWLEQRVMLQLAAISTASSSFEVNAFSKEMDAGMIAWKGAAIMSCLESAPELWIFGGEWEKYGLRVLREKAPFIW